MTGSGNGASHRELTLADLKFDPPRLPLSALRDMAARYFNVVGEPLQLDGERDQNCRITTDDGRSFVLKVASSSENPQTVDFQVAALDHIALHDAALPVPRVVRGAAGAAVCWADIGTCRHAVRLLTYLPGIPYQEGTPPTEHGLDAIGSFIARLGRALTGFRHPAQGHFMPWDSTNDLIFRPQLKSLLTPELQALIAPSLARLEHKVFPALRLLPAQVIHHDGHGANLLRSSQESEAVAGVIDFGDMIHAPVVCDLAVCAADFLDHTLGPARVITAMCRGYAREYPLTLTQGELLPDMIIARLIRILMLFEFRRSHMTQPPAFVTSDRAIYRNALKALLALDRERLTENILEACA